MPNDLRQTGAEKARIMRASGATYREISTETGVSVDWCKKNLKTVSKPRSNDSCIQEIINLGVRPQGITDYEATGIIFKYHSDANTNKIRYIKDKAKEIEPKCLIHSGWIDYMNPNASHKAMNAFALHLMDQVDNMVKDYIEMYPNSNKWSVRYEMLKLAFSRQISPEPISSRVYKNEKLAEVVEDRLTQSI